MPEASTGDDPDDALRRLESMGSGAAAGPPRPEPGYAPLPPSPVVDPYTAPSREPRQTTSTKRTPRARPRPAASRSGRFAARVVAPVVFLIAVIAFFGIVVNSHVLGGGDETPTPTATATKTVTSTKKYTVKSGDSLSSIANRYGITTSELLELNPKLDSASTLVVGKRIIVPAQ